MTSSLSSGSIKVSKSPSINSVPSNAEKLSVEGVEDDDNAVDAHDRPTTRRVWGKSLALSNDERGSVISGASESPLAWARGGSPVHKHSATTNRNNTASSAAKYSQLAKYAAHHLPDPTSRCASRLVKLIIMSTVLFHYISFGIH